MVKYQNCKIGQIGTLKMGEDRESGTVCKWQYVIVNLQIQIRIIANFTFANANNTSLILNLAIIALECKFTNE